MLGAAFVLLGLGLVAIFQPAIVEPVLDSLRLGDYRTAIGIGFIFIALWLFVRKL
jgi:energy-converting hydrogenase Eha subunit E